MGAHLRGRGPGAALLVAVALLLSIGSAVAQAQPTVSVADTHVLEGTGASTTAHFTVSLSEPAPAGGVTAHYSTTDGTAISTSQTADYVSTTGNLSIPEGETSTQVDVPVSADTMDENDESFTLQVSNAQAPGIPASLIITDALGVATIEDDDAPPAVVVGDAQVQGGAVITGQSPPVTFTLTLAAVSAKTVTVHYETQDGLGPNGAVACQLPPASCTPADGDYVPASGTRTFPPGVTQQSVSVTAIGDSLDVDRNFELIVTSPSTLESTGATFSLADEGHPISVAGVPNSVGTYASAHEIALGASAGNGTGLAFFTGPSFVDGVVVGTDLTSAAATFAPGDVGKPIMVAGQANTIAAVLGDHEITLGTAATDGVGTAFFFGPGFSDGIVSGGQVTATGSIPSAGPLASIANVTVNEGAPGATTHALVTVTLDAASAQDLSVAYTSADDTAKAPADYTAVPANSRLTIPAGHTTGTIDIPVKGNALNEADKSFKVSLGSPQHVRLPASPTAVVTIKNDDPTPRIVAHDLTVAEPSGTSTNANVAVSLSAPSGRQLTATYETHDGTALAGTNYGKTTGTLTFAPGETTKQVTIPIGDDGKVLDDQSFTLVIQNTADGGGSVTARVNITEGDLTADTTPNVSINDAAVHATGKAADALFTVRLDRALGRHVSVDYVTANGTAVAPHDFAATHGTLSFAPGQTTKTVKVHVSPNAKPRFNSDFSVKLSHPVSARVSRATGIGVIVNAVADLLPARVRPTAVRATDVLCRHRHACRGLVARWTAPARGRIRVTVTALLPPAKRGRAARRLVLVTHSRSVRHGGGKLRVRRATGRATTRLLRRVQSAKAATLEVTVAFTDELGVQTAARVPVKLRR